MLCFMLQWAVREIERSNGCPLHSLSSTQTWPPLSQVLCTSVRSDHTAYILHGEEHMQIANNSMAHDEGGITGETGNTMAL